MAYTYKIEQAIKAAAVLHKDQVRKGEIPIPVITHLISTAMIVSDYADDEDIIAAAFLHDTIEDTDYTIDELQEDFGGNVADMVEALTEPQYENGEKVIWEKQKSVYAEQLKNAPEGSLIIAAADKIHNMRCIVEDYVEDHARFRADFGGNYDQRIGVYQAIADVLTERLDNPILEEFETVFAEYVQFVEDVKHASKEN